jgi:hypothetical protein
MRIANPRGDTTPAAHVPLQTPKHKAINTNFNKKFMLI